MIGQRRRNAMQRIVFIKAIIAERTDKGAILRTLLLNLKNVVYGIKTLSMLKLDEILYAFCEDVL